MWKTRLLTARGSRAPPAPSPGRSLWVGWPERGYVPRGASTPGPLSAALAGECPGRGERPREDGLRKRRS